MIMAAYTIYCCGRLNSTDQLFHIFIWVAYATMGNVYYMDYRLLHRVACVTWGSVCYIYSALLQVDISAYIPMHSDNHVKIHSRCSTSICHKTCHREVNPTELYIPNQKHALGQKSSPVFGVPRQTLF